MPKSKKSIAEKIQEEYPEFAEEVIGLSSEQLDSRLATLAKNLDETETAKENDRQLEDAQGLVSELSGPYKDARKALKLKSKYVIHLLKEKGAL